MCLAWRWRKWELNILGVPKNAPLDKRLWLLLECSVDCSVRSEVSFPLLTVSEVTPPCLLMKEDDLTGDADRLLCTALSWVYSCLVLVLACSALMDDHQPLPRQCQSHQCPGLGSLSTSLTRLETIIFVKTQVIESLNWLIKGYLLLQSSPTLPLFPFL